MKIAVVVYAGPGDIARGYRAFGVIEDFKDAGDDIVAVFDGNGVETLAAYLDPGHAHHQLYLNVWDVILGTCSVCARVHRVQQKLESAGIEMLRDHKGHASIRNLVAAGYQVITI